MGLKAEKKTTWADPPQHVRLSGPKGAGRPPKVDRDNGIIYGYSVITGGVEALGHGEYIDDVFLEQVKTQGQLAPRGIKVRLTHPSLSGDGMLSHLARAKNFRRVGDQVVADMHLLESARNVPGKGDIGEHVMSLAEEGPDLFGTSIVFQPDLGAMAKFMAEHADEDGEFTSPDKRNTRNYPHARLAALFASDVVDEPAANPAGFFSFPEGGEMPARAEALAKYALGLTDAAPDPVAMGPHPERARRFLAEFLGRNGLKVVRGEDSPRRHGEHGEEKEGGSSVLPDSENRGSVSSPTTAALVVGGGSGGEGLVEGKGELIDPQDGLEQGGEPALPGPEGEAKGGRMEKLIERTQAPEEKAGAAPTKAEVGLMLAELEAQAEQMGLRAGKGAEGVAKVLAVGGSGEAAPGGTTAKRELRKRAGLSGERKTTGKAGGMGPSRGKKEGKRMPEAMDMTRVKELQQRLEAEDDVNELRSLAKTAADLAHDLNEDAKGADGRGKLDADQKELFRQYADVAESAGAKADELEQREIDAYAEKLTAEAGSGGGERTAGRRSTIQMGADRSDAREFSLAKFCRGLKTDIWTNADKERRASYATMQPHDSVLGGTFVPEVMSREVIKNVRAASGLDMVATIKTMTAEVNHYPKITQGPTTQWIGPGGNTINASDIRTGSVELRKRVCAALIPVDNRQLQAATPEFEEELRGEIFRAMAEAAFVALFFGSGNGPEPRGLIHWTGLREETTKTLGNLTLAFTKELKRWVRKKNHTCDFLAMTTDMFDKLDDEETTTGAPKLAAAHTESGRRRIAGVDVLESNLLRFPLTGTTGYMFGGEKASLFAGFGNRFALDVDSSKGFAENVTYFRALMEFDCAVADINAFSHRIITSLDS